MSFLKSLLDGNEREVVRLRKVASEINVLEPEFQALQDEELAGKTAEFRERLDPAVQRLDEATADRQEAKDPAEQSAADAVGTDAFAVLEAEHSAITHKDFA